jgi:hypothetical protein
VLKKRSGTNLPAGLYRLEKPLQEKPQVQQQFPEHSRRVAGRYILTANIFESLATTGSELTSALNVFWESLTVFEFSKNLLSLSPYKGILDTLNALKAKPQSPVSSFQR